MIKQSLNIIAKFPTIVAYSYQALRHLYKGKTLSIRHPQPNLTTAENFLYLIKGDCNGFSKLEADLLDLLLVLHAEHGGGNNSTFTMRVTSSSETDIYSSITSAIGSLKGPLHGGANVRVLEMMDNMKIHVKDWADEEEVKAHLLKILNKKANDNSGKDIWNRTRCIYNFRSKSRNTKSKSTGNWQLKKAGLMNLNFIHLWKDSPPRFSEYSKEKNQRRLYVSMSISIPALYIQCSISRRNFIHPSLQSEEFRDGAHTGSRSLHSPQKES